MSPAAGLARGFDADGVERPRNARYDARTEAYIKDCTAANGGARVMADGSTWHPEHTFDHPDRFRE